MLKHLIFKPYLRYHVYRFSQQQYTQTNSPHKNTRIISKVVYDASSQPGVKKVSKSILPPIAFFTLGFLFLGLWFSTQSNDLRSFLRKRSDEFALQHGLKKESENRGTSALNLNPNDYVKQVREILQQSNYSK